MAPFYAASKIIVHSSLEAELLIRNYQVARKRVEVVPHGVDAIFAEPTDGGFVRSLGIERYVLCVGRIEPQKNQLRLIRALAGSGYALALVGVPTPGSESYIARCREVAGPEVHFIGPVPHESLLLVDLFRHAAVVAVPSEFETWSLVAYEAAVAGTPLAITRNGPTADLLSRWAEPLDPRSELDIRRAIDRAAARGRSDAQSREALAYASWPAVARKMKAVYSAALEDR